MMGLCMGICAGMLTSIKETWSLAAFATPDLQKTFETWLAKLENRAGELLKKKGSLNAKSSATSLSLDELSAAYLLSRVARRDDVEVVLKTHSQRPST